MNNLLQLTEYSRLKKSFTNGLNYYVQNNCQVTLTDNGCRIYRPANLTQANDGNTMWGGLILRPFQIASNIMVKGNSYCLMFDIDGKSTNDNEFYWSNNAGWGGGSYGLGTSPTNIANNMKTGANFNGTKRLYYAFKITDDIMKTCTKSYSSFVEGNSYNTYRDFKWGYTYGSTGSLGTDIYISKIRMYDISNIEIPKILKNGILDTGAIIEYGVSSSFSLQAYGEIRVSEIIED